MALAPAQLPTFKTDILANTDPVVVAALASGANQAIADWYRQTAAPNYYIYRKEVTAKEVSDAIDLNNIANITTADSDRVVKFFTIRSFDGGSFSGQSASDRAAFDDVFSAAAGDESQQAIAALWTRLANYAEKLFVVSGTGTSIDPAITEFEGLVSGSDVVNALNS